MPTTDWQLVRDLLAAAVDACEAAERLGLADEDRGLPTGAGPVDVGDVLASAWTYPENVRYGVVRARHALGADAPFQPELARALREVGGLCAELVGAGAVTDATPPRDGRSAPSLRAEVEALAAWYRGQMVPQLTQAAAGRPAA
ncbi:MAG TPA: hypothetical protein VGD91_25980 [Trebonia sp.]